MKRIVVVTVLLAFLSAVASRAQTPASKPGPEHKKLNIWVGDWTYKGETYATPLGPAEKYTGKATARLILDGFFVEWRGEQKGPSGRSQMHGIDRYDARNKNYTWSGFTSDGEFDSLTYTIDGTTVKNSGTMLKGEKQHKLRSTIVFADDFRSFVEKMEISPDGQTWMPHFQNRWRKDQPVPVDSRAEADEVRGVDAQWASAIKTKDLDKIMGFFASDAVAIDANVPIRTSHSSIRKAYQDWLADPAVSRSFTSTLDTVEVSASGDLAYVRGVNRWSETTPEGRVAQVSKFVTIYRKVDGKWKAVVDIGAADQPVPKK